MPITNVLTEYKYYRIDRREIFKFLKVELKIPENYDIISICTDSSDTSYLIVVARNITSIDSIKEEYSYRFLKVDLNNSLGKTYLIPVNLEVLDLAQDTEDSSFYLIKAKKI